MAQRLTVNAVISMGMLTGKDARSGLVHGLTRARKALAQY